jgi:hypothetical protein
LAPSIAAASSVSCGSPWIPASRTRNRNGVVRQRSTRMIAAMAVDGVARNGNCGGKPTKVASHGMTPMRG